MWNRALPTPHPAPVSSAIFLPHPPLPPPPQIELPLITARATSQEALRAFSIAALGGWTADRLSEAGVDDLVRLPPFLVVNPGVTSDAVPLQLVGWSMAALVTALALLPILVIVASEAQVLAAAALVLETSAGREVARQLRQREQSKSSRTVINSDSITVGGTNETGRAAAQTTTTAALDALLGPLGSEAAAAAADGGDDSSGGEDDQPDPLVLEWRLQYASEQCTGSAPAQLAGYFAFARGSARLLAAHAAFVASGGNPAALLAGSWGLEGLQLICASLIGGGGPRAVEKSDV